MATTNLDLRDIGISHAIGLRRLSTGTARDIVKLLDEADADIVAKLEKYDPGAKKFYRERLTTLLGEIRAVNKNIYKQVGSQLKSDLTDAATYEAKYQAKAVGGVLGGMLNLPARDVLVAAVSDEPFQGRLLKEWVDGLEAGRFARLRDAIRLSVVEGEGIQQTVTRIVGTPELNYRDGILQISRRSAEALARTAVNAVTTQARQLTYEENQDILDGWSYVATLEPSTCEVCAALDGEEYDISAGPYPPRHPNCRCTTVPVVKGGGSTSRVTYTSWLADQPTDVQDEALGPTRAALYREGKLQITKFADDNRAYTLDELRKKEPRAFTRAGV